MCELWVSGYPDITANDGLYSAYIPTYATSPGYYRCVLYYYYYYYYYLIFQHQAQGGRQPRPGQRAQGSDQRWDLISLAKKGINFGRNLARQRAHREQ